MQYKWQTALFSVCHKELELNNTMHFHMSNHQLISTRCVTGVSLVQMSAYLAAHTTHMTWLLQSEVLITLYYCNIVLTII